MLKFDFLDKGLGINFIAWLLLILEILANMYIAIFCYPGQDVMDFEINLIFLIELFFLYDQKFMTKP